MITAGGAESTPCVPFQGIETSVMVFESHVAGTLLASVRVLENLLPNPRIKVANFITLGKFFVIPLSR